MDLISIGSKGKFSLPNGTRSHCCFITFRSGKYRFSLIIPACFPAGIRVRTLCGTEMVTKTKSICIALYSIDTHFNASTTDSL